MSWDAIIANFLSNNSKTTLDGNEFPSNKIVGLKLDLSKSAFEPINQKIFQNFVFEESSMSFSNRAQFIRFIDCVFGQSGDKFDENLMVTVRADYHKSILSFIRCQIVDRLLLNDCNVQGISFLACFGFGELEVNEGSSKHFLLQTNKQPLFLNALTFFNCERHEKVTVLDVQLDSLNFIQEVPRNIHIGNGKYREIDFRSSSDINNLTVFRNKGPEEKELVLEIEYFIFEYKAVKGKLILDGATIDQFTIRDLSGIGEQFLLRNLTIRKQFQIIESNLKNTFFYDLDLTGIKPVFDFTTFRGLDYANVTWDKSYEVETEPMDALRQYKTKTEVYRQLKKAATDNNNNFDKLKFQRNELAAYWNRVELDKTESRANRFLLRIDKLFSNFGQDYLRPLLWLLGVQLVLCVMIWCREDGYHHYNAPNYLMAFENGLAQYFSMIIPVFKNPDYWTGASIFLTVIVRLFNALMIYHFIRAVHKFGKTN